MTTNLELYDQYKLYLVKKSLSEYEAAEDYTYQGIPLSEFSKKELYKLVVLALQSKTHENLPTLQKRSTN